ncbi:MAG: ribosome small subunit-dependent GTPase A [Bacillales bacterium]|jgi:ribosome biogenesis GTPase|nr:ribosome small subunit-dependent GTPase A [Bacillales bacterium]
MKGFIIKSNMTNYIVYGDDNKRYMCSCNKNIKKNGPIFAGDYVEFENEQIKEIYPRKNFLLRPRVANIDNIVVIASLVEPVVNELMVNRYFVFLTVNKIDPILLISKSDLVNFPHDKYEQLKKQYNLMGFEIYKYSAKTGENIDNIKELFKGKKVLLAGQTGVGKSKLINKILGTENITTQEISHALGRGKHTTTYVEFHQYKDGWIIDSPGFSYIDFSALSVNKEQLSLNYPTFNKVKEPCRFSDCKHLNEPDCAIKEAVKNGIIKTEIYDDYLKILKGMENEK